MMRSALLGLLALAGCSAAPHSKSAGAVSSLAVKPVVWNPANAPIAHVRAVADSGDVVAVFTDDGASILSAKALVAKDESAKGWPMGSTIVAPDGTTSWIVGIDGQGHVHRLRGMTSFEDVTARYGLGDRKVREAALAGPGKVGFLLDGQVAVGSASKIAVYPTDRFTALAGGGDFIAGVEKNYVSLVNATNAIVTKFSLPGVTAAAIDAKGRLYATTERGVYAADASGALGLVFDAGHDGLHGLVASGDKVWFADREELGIVLGDRVAETTGLGLGKNAVLQRSSNGDVWVIDSGKLARYEAESSASTATSVLPGSTAPVLTTWSSVVGPVFARSCAQCHQPDGVSGTDLSTENAWRHKAPLVRERVLVDKTMPPQGHVLADADRTAIKSWLDAMH